MDNAKIRDIAGKFDIHGEILDVKPLGQGLINDTFRVITTDGNPDYVLQRINNSIFRDVELLQHNIEAVTGHIRGKLQTAGEADIERKVLTLVPVKDSDKTYIIADGQYWRMTVLIAGSVTKSEVTPESSNDTGRAFGAFEAMLADIPETLGETIPDFHNMELRSRQLKEAVAADAGGRVSEPEVKELLEIIAAYDEEMCKAERLHREGVLPKRICHCDAKVNNILFDEQGKVLCVIDLDTVMPSYVFSDFGDFLRTGANTVAEDDPDTDKVAFRMDIFEAFAAGYLQSASSFLTPVEKENLPFAALLFPYMQAVRFLTDYINGDTYYKISYPEHNLVRTRNQIALFRSALSHLDEMKAFVASH